MCLDVAVEVVADQIVVSMVHDRIAKSREMASVTKHTSFDGVEYLLKVFVQLKLAVSMSMAEVFHILSKIAKEKYVALSNLACDLDLL